MVFSLGLLEHELPKLKKEFQIAEQKVEKAKESKKEIKDEIDRLNKDLYRFVFVYECTWIRIEMINWITIDYHFINFSNSEAEKLVAEEVQEKEEIIADKIHVEEEFQSLKAFLMLEKNR